MNRRQLPMDSAYPPFEAALDLRDHEGNLPARSTVSAPEGAPNVLVILLDDMGFGAPSVFGGPCRMPTAERLANTGLRYTRFHTTALCSPTRAALLTGRNHHATGMGSVVDLSTGTPGYDGIRPRSAATLAQILGYNGYLTGCFGKWHQTPPWEQTAAGPFDRWPTGEGFDHFYGFLGGEVDQFNPILVRDTTFIEAPDSENYHFSEDIVDRNIAWLDKVTRYSGKPWFSYLSFGATHAPLQVPESWIDRYRGEFSHGWNVQRERTLAEQKRLGVVAESAELTAWPDNLPHWDDLGDDQRLVAERLMEIYAAFAEHTDAQVGRLIDHLAETGQLDNTLVLYILGDNGPSGEGGVDGATNESIRFNATEESLEHVLSRLDDLGGPHTYAHYPTGWAHAMSTPYQHVKQIASHYGGTRNGMVVHWPAGTSQVGEVRDQWHHVNDVLPTICEAIGIPLPESVDGVAQDELDGVSFAPTFTTPEAPETHHTQYFEMFGNRGIYHEGWTAVAYHRPSHLIKRPSIPLADDRWELYDTRDDWSQARDVAAEYPDKLAELQALFVAEGHRNRVFPIDDGTTHNRMNADLAGRVKKRITRMVLTPEDGFLREDAVPNVKNTSFRVTAEVTTTADGVLIAQGGRFNGWSFYIRDRHPTFVYNFVSLDVTHVRSTVPLSDGEHTLVAYFDYDGGGLGAGGELTLLVDGSEVGRGRIPRTTPHFFSMDQTLNVGVDRGTPVTDDYPRSRFPYAGDLKQVTIEVGDDAMPIDVEGYVRGHITAQ